MLTSSINLATSNQPRRADRATNWHGGVSILCPFCGRLPAACRCYSNNHGASPTPAAAERYPQSLRGSKEGCLLSVGCASKTHGAAEISAGLSRLSACSHPERQQGHALPRHGRDTCFGAYRRPANHGAL